MSDYLGKLLVDKDEIAKSLRERRKKHIEKTVSVAVTKSTTKGKKKKARKTKAEILELLTKKAALEEADGWAILRKSKYSFRLKKDKPLDEQLEDEVWTILARMGFDELSEGRNFKINNPKDPNPRQIDVFAKDRETAIIVECTCCEKPTKKSMSTLIEKIESIKRDSSIAINKHFGNNPKLKIGWVIATRNIEWGTSDLEKACGHSITVITQNEIEYYSKLTDHLKKAAKYQLLSHLFANEEISALDFAVSATRGKMGKRVFYNFLIKPADLLKIAYIGHKGSRNIEDLETYQRMLSPKRLKDIASYIDNGGQFPTNIVVNMKSRRDIRFEAKKNVGDSAFGILYLPRMYASCWIIDGQHRLYGYMYSEHSKNPDDQTTLPVLAYEKLTPVEEATFFVDINCKQVKVTRRLLNELYANLTWDSPDFKERIEALCSRIVAALNSRSTSPVQDRIQYSNTKKTHLRCLTITSFVDGLKENKFFGAKANKPGPLSDSTKEDLECTLKKAVSILLGYLTFFAETMPGHWEKGDDKGGYLCTNNGIRSLLALLKEILWYLEFKEMIVVDSEPYSVILPQVKRLVQPAINYFKSASDDEVFNFRSRQALTGVRKNALLMMKLIQDKYPDFLPAGLKEFIDNMDKEGTLESRDILDKLQNRFYIFVIKLLKDKYGEQKERWWYDGIPPKVRKDCSDRHEDEGGIKRKEQYLSLIDYREIVKFNWDIFDNYFTIDEKGNKSKRTEWMVKLNSIRNITAHTEKWPLTKDQVMFVREMNNKLSNRFEI